MQRRQVRGRKPRGMLLPRSALMLLRIRQRCYVCAVRVATRASRRQRCQVQSPPPPPLAGDSTWEQW